MRSRTGRIALLAGVLVIMLALIGVLLPTQRASADVSDLVDRLQQCGPVSSAFTSLGVAPEIQVKETIPVPANYVRLWDVGTSWRDIAKTKGGGYDWSVLDDRVKQAEKSGLKPLYVFGLTPLWAAADKTAGDVRWGVGSASPPVDTQDLVNFATALVDHFGSRITAYELWNEGNLKTFWSGTPAQLADMTSQVYAAIKSKQPGSMVIAPSTTIRLASPMKRFVSGFYEQAAKTATPFAFDAFTIHSYPGGTEGPADRRRQIAEFQTALATAIGADNAAVLDRPIWDTEVNYGLAGGTGSTPHTDYTDAQAADLLRTTYADSLALGIDAVFWYMYTKTPYALLGAQFWSGAPEMNAAWSEIRAKYVTGANLCAGLPAAGGGSSGAAPSPTPGGSDPADDPNAPDDIPTLPVVVLPPELIPPAGETTVLAGVQQASCTETSSSSSVSAGCAPVTPPACNPANISHSQLTPRVLPAGSTGSTMKLAVNPELVNPVVASAAIVASVTSGVITPAIDPTGMVFAPAFGPFFSVPSGAIEPIPPSPPLPPLPPAPPVVSTPSSTPSPSIPGTSSGCALQTRIGRLATTTTPVFARGGIVTFRVIGMLPGKPVTVYAGTVPKPAGKFIAGTDGSVTGWFRIPNTAPLGATWIQINGMLSSTTSLSITSGVSMRAGVLKTGSGTVRLDAKSGVLSRADRKRLSTALRRMPITASCVITPAGGPKPAAAADAKAVRAFIAKSGVGCTIAKKTGTRPRLLRLDYRYLT